MRRSDAEEMGMVREMEMKERIARSCTHSGIGTTVEKIWMWMIEVFCVKVKVNMLIAPVLPHTTTD